MDCSREEAKIVSMGESDLDAVLAIEAGSFLAPWSRQSFQEEMKHPLASCFVLKAVARPSTPVIGYLCFRTILDESELLKVGIHPAERRKGYGKRLMQFYFDFCQSRAIQAFHLETGISNEAAIRLYQSFSYRPAGIRPRLYRGQEDALRMTRKASPQAQGKAFLKPHL